MEEYPILAYELVTERNSSIQQNEARYQHEADVRQQLGQRRFWMLHDIRAMIQRFYAFFEPVETNDLDGGGLTQRRTYA